jgi:hypothetical protein
MLTLFVLFKVILFTFWFSIGVFSYLKIKDTNTKIQTYIDRLSFFELSFILFLIFFLLQLIAGSIGEYLYNMIIINEDFIVFMSNNNQPSNSENVSSGLSSAGDSMIMATSLSGAAKLAQGHPSVATKIACLGCGVCVGCLAIVGKTLTGNISKIVGKDKFLNLDDLNLNEILQLSGNDVADLLQIIQYFHILQFILLILLCYYLLINRINEFKLEEIISKILPIKVVNFILKNLRYMKKINKFIIIFLIIFIIISNLYSYHLLKFFIDNFDGIAELYIKTK